MECCLEENEETLVKLLNMPKEHLEGLKKELNEFNEVMIRADEAGELG
jgi:hypothetical protein